MHKQLTVLINRTQQAAEKARYWLCGIRDICFGDKRK